MGADYLREGRVVGNQRIKQLVNSAPTIGASTYWVACQRCGGHHLLTHIQLLNRERKQSTRCAICEHKNPDQVAPQVEQSIHDVALAIARLEPDRLEAFPFTVPHVRAADRSIWPSLGRMGPRFG